MCLNKPVLDFMTKYNGPDGLLPRRLPAPHRLVTIQSLSNKNSLKKKTVERMAHTTDTYKQKIIQQGYARA
jgi:hypothetical protein